VTHFGSVTRGVFVGVLFAAGSLSLYVAHDVLAARPPTKAERVAITRVLPAHVRNTQVGCVWLIIEISTRNHSFASVGGMYLGSLKPHDPCLHHAGNWFYVLRKKTGRWRIYYSGTDLPRCRLGIPKDLVSCRR
jgi:hypothetical protein